MNLLLDTHVLLWCLGAPHRLARETRKKIEKPETVVFVSAASAWEIEIKRALGKLKVPDDLAEQLQEKRFTELPVRVRHVAELRSLPELHRDPFDRMLVAQAIAENLAIVTSDDKLKAYAAKTIDA